MKVTLKVPVGGTLGIEECLKAMTHLMGGACDHVPPEIRELAKRLTDPFTNRREDMTAFIDELHRRFQYAADPLDECVGPIPFKPGTRIDADDACMFVAALAVSAGIPCRFVGARYGRSWTCFLEYQESHGSWTMVDPMRQSGIREPDELVRVDV